MKNTRTAEILVNGEWVSIEPIDITAGMFFRMFEETGEPVIGLEDSTVWEAIGDAYFNKDGIVTIDIK